MKRREVWKRGLAVLMTAALLAGNNGITAFAAWTETDPVSVEAEEDTPETKDDAGTGKGEATGDATAEEENGAEASGEDIEFLKLLDLKYPQGDKIRLVLDNLKVHTSEETKKYLATVPGRFEFVFTPKHGSWLNLVEGFFSKLTRQSLKGIRVKTKEELVERIYRYFEEVNADPVIYRWKYRLDEIDPSEQVQVDTLSLKKSS